MRIALLEDDADQSAMIVSWMEGVGHKVTSFKSGKDLVKTLRNESFDLLILDWMVPDLSGMEVLDWTRSHYDWNIPIMFTTALDSEEDVVKALRAGADDYMVKPLRKEELVARLNALSRRLQLGQTTTQVLEFPPYTVDMSARAIRLNDEWIELTQKEYELASFLFKNVGRAISRGHILDAVWGTSPELNTRTVDTHVSRLRKKLKFSRETGWGLTSIYQHGYRLEKLPDSPHNEQAQQEQGATTPTL